MATDYYQTRAYHRLAAAMHHRYAARIAAAREQSGGRRGDPVAEAAHLAAASAHEIVYQPSLLEAVQMPGKLLDKIIDDLPRAFGQ